MQWYKQSTAASLVVGPILDSTGVEYASALIGDLSISKNGGTLTALAAAATLTYIANGYYTLALTTGNTDTLGRADINVNKAGYQMPPRELMVLPATVYDALTTNATNATGGLVAATGSVTGVTGVLATTTNITAATGIVLSGVTHTGAVIPTVTTVTNQLTAAQIATGVWQDTTAGDFTVASSIGKSLYTSGNVPGAASGLALVGSNMGSVASVSGSVGSVTAGVTVTTNNDKTGYSLASGGLASVTAWTVAITGNITGNLSGSVGSVTTVSDKTGYSLTVTPPTAAAVATAVWQDTTAGDFTVANSIGKSLYNSFTANTSVFTTGALANAPTGGSAPTANEIADTVLRRTMANVEASSYGDTLSVSSLYGVAQQAQESATSGTTLTIYKTDGTTILGTKTLTTNAAADPITGIA